MNDDESQEPDNEFNDVSVDEIREPDSESNDTPVDEVQAESDAIHAKFIAEPAQEPDEGFGFAFEEIMRLKAVGRMIKMLERSSTETDNLTKKCILEREVEAILGWIDHKRETPTTGHILLADYGLQSERHPPADVAETTAPPDPPESISTWPRIEEHLGHSRHSIETYAKRCRVTLVKNKVGRVSIALNDAQKIMDRFPPKKR